MGEYKLVFGSPRVPVRAGQSIQSVFYGISAAISGNALQVCAGSEKTRLILRDLGPAARSKILTHRDHRCSGGMEEK